MDYIETCEYLFNQLPMFEKQGTSGYKEGLSNTLKLDEHFGHPHETFACVHVGGTNGKGSVSHMIASVLQECGYRVGLYTSPHLVDFRERIRVNGLPIEEEYVVSFVERERAFFEPLHPSFFEVTTAMAFKYFKDKGVDIAVVEVGLGGRLDCTNIIKPVVSVITNISFDHMQLLGNTLAEIATEKAGIIKSGIPAVIGESNNETRPIFEAKAKEVGAPIVFAEDDNQIVSGTPAVHGGMHFKTLHFGELESDLGGIYQEKNVNTVLAALKELSKQGFLGEFRQENGQHINLRELKSGIAHVTANTGLKGRWQIVKTSPMVVCDTGHNVGGWQYLSQQLQQVPCHNIHIVFGMVNDKDVDGVLKLLPKDAKYYFTKADSHRALNEMILRAKATKYGIDGTAYQSVSEAYKAASEVVGDDDLIFVGGSTYVVGDFLKKCV